MQKLIGLLLCFAVLRAQADCQDIRLDIEGSMSSLPVFDQATAGGERDMNVCYAAAAAQLLDASRFGSKKISSAEMTSPWWLAANYSQQFKTKNANADIAFGETDKALEMAKLSGVCSQADLFEDRKTEEIIQFHGELRSIYKGEERENKLKKLLSEFHFLKDPQKLTEVSAKVLKEKSFLSFLRLLFQEKCHGKVQQEPAFAVERRELDRDPLSIEAKRDLIRQTLINQQPLEASICSQVLRNPEYSGFSEHGSFARDCMRHSVLILGSRSKGGSCQYLIRDTYGSQSCARKRKGNSWYHSSLKCEAGQVWVPEKSLFQNTWGVTRVLRSEQKTTLNPETGSQKPDGSAYPDKDPALPM